MPQNPATGVEESGGPQSGAPAGDAPNRPFTIGYAANGEPVVLAIGNAANDGAIVTEIGADAKFADGSLYLSTGTGLLFQKRSDLWTNI